MRRGMSSNLQSDNDGPSTSRGDEGAVGGEPADRDPQNSRTDVYGGNFNRPHFGPSYCHQEHHHYYYTAAPPQDAAVGKHDNVVPPQDAAAGEHNPAVPPQDAVVDENGVAKKLTDAIWVYNKKPLTRKCNVYAGYQNMGMFKRHVAIKIVPHDPKRLREAQNLLKLTPHVNVVQIIHADIITGSVIKDIYIVMDQCQTMSLDAYYVKRRKSKMPFNTKQALEFSHQIIEGINHIHKNDIIHRDLKPSSVLFSLDGKSLKIIDFGMSKQLEQGMTTMSVSTKLGDDGYRAPETYERDEIKRLADVFSLGLLLYHLWSYGFHPFGDDPTIWCYHIKTKTDPNLSKLLVPDKDKAIDLLCHMLQKSLDDRYRILQALQHDYIRQGIQKTLLTGMVETCCGLFKSVGDQAIDMCCRMYHREGNPNLAFHGQRVKFQLSFIPQARLKTVFPEMDRMPDGFLALPKDKYTKLMKIFKNDKKMGWVNIFFDGDRKGAIVMVRPKDYEELICIFFQDPEDLVSVFRESHPREETVSREQDMNPEPMDEKPEQTVIAQSSHDVPLQSDDQASGEPSASQIALTTAMHQEHDDVGDGDETYMAEEQNLPQITIGQPEYVSWWTYRKPDNR